MRPSVLIGAALLAAGVLCGSQTKAEKAVPIPVLSMPVVEAGGKAVAVLAGGCFWGVEAVFENVRGVISVESGYAGGAATDARYDLVAAEKTRHAEAIRIVYDPRQVSYAALLQVFFSVVHDPTQLNRQGPDVGASYRSAIFPQSPAQDKAARAYIGELGKARVFPRAIVTRIEAGKFYPAESYHQDFMKRNPNHPYIIRWDRPKVAAFKVGFPKLARPN